MLREERAEGLQDPVNLTGKKQLKECDGSYQLKGESENVVKS